MKYKFNYRPSALDLWKLSMYGIYSSMAGTVNIIFTISMVLLAGRFWGDVSGLLKTILIFGIFLFPIIQPVSIYLRAKKEIGMIPSDIEIGFDDKGIHIRSSKNKSDLKWSKVKRVIKKPGMIIILLITNQGYIITNEILGDKREEFYKYLISKMKK